MVWHDRDLPHCLLDLPSSKNIRGRQMEDTKNIILFTLLYSLSPYQISLAFSLCSSWRHWTQIEWWGWSLQLPTGPESTGNSHQHTPLHPALLCKGTPGEVKPGRHSSKKEKDLHKTWK